MESHLDISWIVQQILNPFSLPYNAQLLKTMQWNCLQCSPFTTKLIKFVTDLKKNSFSITDELGMHEPVYDFNSGHKAPKRFKAGEHSANKSESQLFYRRKKNIFFIITEESGSIIQ